MSAKFCLVASAICLAIAFIISLGVAGLPLVPVLIAAAFFFVLAGAV